MALGQSVQRLSELADQVKRDVAQARSLFLSTQPGDFLPPEITVAGQRAADAACQAERLYESITKAVADVEDGLSTLRASTEDFFGGSSELDAEIMKHLPTKNDIDEQTEGFARTTGQAQEVASSKIEEATRLRDAVEKLIGRAPSAC